MWENSLKIYLHQKLTSSGSILVAVNPYKFISGLYEQNEVVHYTNKRIGPGAKLKQTFIEITQTKLEFRILQGKEIVISNCLFKLWRDYCAALIILFLISVYTVAFSQKLLNKLSQFDT